ncbi:DUF327 family protein YaaR [Candidatus Syntrophocurvum alkaliphilum]|uniref:DUF327 family protein YaaR n=1 Tax=Candidatus Syntrophocurvum alkaliphilum TaxID=2293317 RepID=A0A6I6DHM2_9FIRM|nr:YaaR family protein [Candidatus Syntrophocurvum alkaliphilum]QGU00583.1 DUF327 family protein YaaR [Candidatus Syntrophocurvum alkaliphilum]
MRVDRNKKGFNRYTSVNKSQIPEVKRGKETTFNQELANYQYIDSQQKLQDLINDIDKLVKKLNTNLNINDLMLYKKMVKAFLQEATSLAYLLEQQRGRGRKGRTLLISIKTVDQEVEKLINEFVNHKQGPMEVLETLDKIRGMLVDLMI